MIATFSLSYELPILYEWYRSNQRCNTQCRATWNILLNLLLKPVQLLYDIPLWQRIDLQFTLIPKPTLAQEGYYFAKAMKQNFQLLTAAILQQLWKTTYQLSFKRRLQFLMYYVEVLDTFIIFGKCIWAYVF